MPGDYCKYGAASPSCCMNVSCYLIESALLHEADAPCYQTTLSAIPRTCCTTKHCHSKLDFDLRQRADFVANALYINNDPVLALVLTCG